MIKNSIEYFKRLVWLLPVILTSILCVYFINLLSRIDAANLTRQIEERNTITDFASFIQTKPTFYRYLDIIGRFEDNYIYVLDESLEPIENHPHTMNCPYIGKIYPYEDENITKLLNTKKSGYFVHKPSASKKIHFQFKHMAKENEKYVVLIGVSNYPRTHEEKELQIAIGILLLFTAITNWLLVAYAKHVRYMCSNKKRIKNNK